MEAEFLKHTVAPELRLCQRVVQPDGKYTLPLVPVPMLKASIHSILAPQQAAEGSLDELLENIGFLVLLIYNFSWSVTIIMLQLIALSPVMKFVIFLGFYPYLLHLFL